MFEVSRVINYNSVILGWAEGGTLEPTSSYFGYAWHWAAVTLLKEISYIKEIVDICFCVCVLRTWMCVCLYGQTGWGCVSSKKICHFFGQTMRCWSFETILFKIGDKKTRPSTGTNQVFHMRTSPNLITHTERQLHLKLNRRPSAILV